MAADEEFALQVTPWTGGATPTHDRIALSATPPEVRAATADPQFDYSPPTDERPFFFNMLKPGSCARVYDLPRGGVMWGIRRARVDRGRRHLDLDRHRREPAGRGSAVRLAVRAAAAASRGG